MKKRLFLLFMVLASLLFIAPSAKASDVANWEFLPLGINYLENDNFIFTRSNPINTGTISTIHYIRVIPNTHYYLYFYSYQCGCFHESTITAYDANKEAIGTINYNMSGESNDIDFITPEGTKYIKMVVGVEEDYGYDLQLYNVESNYILADHTLNVGSLQMSDIKYKGPNIDYSPVIDGYNGHFISNVDNPSTLASILNGVRAIDDVDGDITSSIQVVSDNYTPHKNEIGLWSVKLSAIDSSDNVSEFTIYVEVKDTTRPVVNGTLTFDINSSNNYNLSYFLTAANVTDNCDGDMTNKIVVTSDQYTNRTSTNGTFKVVCYCVDASGNRLDFTITINESYNDSRPPVFTGTFSYSTDKNNPITLATILSRIAVNDDYDGEITNRVRVVEDFYSHAPNRIGSFRVVLGVSDSSGNYAQQKILITVSDSVSPSFYLNTQVINIDLSNSSLEVADFVDILERSRTIVTDCSYKVTYDEYSENKDKPGEYQIVFDVNGEPLALTVNVIEGLEQKSVTFFNKVASFVVTVFSRVKTFFTKLFRFR